MRIPYEEGDDRSMKMLFQIYGPCVYRQLPDKLKYKNTHYINYVHIDLAVELLDLHTKYYHLGRVDELRHTNYLYVGYVDKLGQLNPCGCDYRHAIVNDQLIQFSIISISIIV